MSAPAPGCRQVEAQPVGRGGCDNLDISVRFLYDGAALVEDDTYRMKILTN